MAELAIFAKKRTTKDNRSFYGYLSTLTRRDGTTQTVAVKFREEAGNPDPTTCPCFINVDRRNMNLSKRDYVNEKTGEVCISLTLWVEKWEPGRAYEDHSLDEFDI